MNSLDKQYTDLLKDILENGTKKTDRTGTGTISVFGRQIRHKMSEGFPLLTTKKMYMKGIVTELLWFLRGDTNIKYLVDNDCHIWDGDAYKSFMVKHGFKKTEVGWEGKFAGLNQGVSGWLTKQEFINKIKTDDEFAKKWGDLGPIYGKQWRKWTKYELSNHDMYVSRSGMMNYQKHRYDVETKQIDQIANLINDLKTNPDSRRLMVSAWNVGEIDQMVLPPCHYGFQVYTRELSLEERWELYHKSDLEPLTPQNGVDDKELHRICDDCFIPTRAISLMWNQRSVDTPLGLPFNIASYGLLLEIIAKEVNMVPDELIGNLGDTHIYLNQVEGVKEQLGRDSYELPKLSINNLRSDTNSIIRDITKWSYKDFELTNYKCHPSIKFPLSN